MSKVLTLFTLTLSLLISINASAVCMTEMDAEFEGCQPTQNKAADKWCSKKYGSGYISFYTTDTCSKQVSFSYRGETYTPSTKELDKVVEASCMYYEDGQKNNCSLYDYAPATKYCLENFGGKFLAFIPTPSCSMSKASALRGEVNSKALVKGLDSSIEEAEALMTMLDKQGINSSLNGFDHKELDVSYEFYTNSVLTLLAKLKGIKTTFVDNGEANVRMTGKYVPHYLKHAFRYLTIVSRLHKLYAYVAHKNQNVLKTYKFDHFSELNLKLKKKYGLEILARVNYKVLTVDNGEYLEFEIGEQDKQTFEYMAMEKPRTKVEYGKLVQYLGVRETLTNHWAVQRLTTTTIPNPKVRECGKGFLSFRPGSSGSMSDSAAMKDLWEHDAFYSSYVKHWGKLIDASREESILSDAAASEMNYYTMTKVKDLKNYMTNDMYNSLATDGEFRQRASEDSELRLLAEDYAWDTYSNDHFASIVMPSDGILSKSKIAKRIADDAYKVRVEGIVNNIQGTFPYVSKSGLEGIKVYVESYMSKVHENEFKTRLERKLVSTLRNYNNQSELRRENRQQKIKETLEVVKKSVQAARILKGLEDEEQIGKMLRLDPENVEELMMFFENKLKSNFDIQYALENNPEWAKELSEFFEDIAKDFNKKYLVKKSGKYEYTGSTIARAQSLREITKKYAKVLHKKFPFDVQGYVLRQYQNRVEIFPRDNTRVARPRLPVFADGKPFNLSNRAFNAEVSQTDINNVLNYVARLDENTADNSNVAHPYFTSNPRTIPGVTPGWNKDKLTTGEVAIPTFINKAGKIISPKGVVGQVNNELLRLVKNANILNKKSVAKLESKPEVLKYTRARKISEEKRIKSMNHFVYRLLTVLNLNMMGYSNGIVGDLFASQNSDQELLAVNKTSQAYQMAPLLRNDYTWTESYRTHVPSHGMYGSAASTTYESKRTKKLPLLTKISLEAYNKKSGYLDERKATQMIDAVITDGIKNAGSKLYKFCAANYLNYKNDQPFKDMFKASGFLRATIKNPMGGTEQEAKHLNDLDLAIVKDIRTKWEAANEDYLEPTLKVLGYAALVALAVVLIIGSGGTAAPGIVGGVYAFASGFLALEFFISFPIVVGSLYARVNTHFVEMPHQLKFQRSLAQSQVDFSQIVDWDMLRSEEAALKSKQAWTIGLMPLDFIYAGALVKHVGKATGTVGRGAYRRLTGVKLRGFSAPPAGTYKIERFKDLRSRLGAPKAIVAKGQQIVNRARAYQPRYQALAPELLNAAPLRIGLSRAAKEAGLQSKPWLLLEEIKTYQKTLSDRLSTYTEFVSKEAGYVQKLKLNGGVGFREVLDNGIQYSKFAFVPSSYLKAVKEGRLVKFLQDNSQMWTELKDMQAKMVKDRATNIGKTVDKMIDFKNGIQAGTIVREGDDLMGQMLKNFSDQEILVLKEISKRSKGKMGNFKQTFKDHARVVEGLRPMGYLYGNTAQKFKMAVYPQNTFMGDIVDVNYKYKSDSEDLINYYESMVSQNGSVTEEANRARQIIEERIAQSMSIDNGVRTYHD